jgi:hypothetical protein
MFIPQPLRRCLGTPTDIRMTLAIIYAQTTEGTQIAATTALEETFSRSGC